MFPVCAEIVVLNGLSSHADHAELVHSLAPLAAGTRHIRLVHGDPDRGEVLAADLRAAGFAEVAMPERGESVVV